MNKQLPFPIILVAGDAYQRGYQYGSQCKKLIAEAVNTYHKIFNAKPNMSWQKALRLAAKFTSAIEEYDPLATDEMRGIAEGAEQAFAHILALNTRYEFLFLAVAEEFKECTTLAAMPEATSSRHLLMAENWDLPSTIQKLAVILKEKQKDGPDIVQITEAGVISKHGFNSAGICILGNALVSDGWHFGVPKQIIVRRILNQESLADAIKVVLAAKRASSGNYMIGYTGDDGSDVVDIEAAPDYYNIIWPDNGILAHANHFSVTNPNIKDLFPPLDPGSLNREHRATKLLANERGNITVDVIKRILRDHFDRKGSSSICCHVDPHLDESLQWLTIASFVIDLDNKTLDIAKGPPCENKYVALTFDDIM